MHSKNNYQGIDKILTLIVRKKAKQLFYSKYFLNSDIEDLEQELMTDLLEQIAIYSPAACAVYRFAKVVVENKSCRLIRLILKQRFHNSYDEELMLDEQEALDPIKDLEQDMAVKSAIGKNNSRFKQLYFLLQFFNLQEISVQKILLISNYIVIYRNYDEY